MSTLCTPPFSLDRMPTKAFPARTRLQCGSGSRAGHCGPRAHKMCFASLIPRFWFVCLLGPHGHIGRFYVQIWISGFLKQIWYYWAPFPPWQQLEGRREWILPLPTLPCLVLPGVFAGLSPLMLRYSDKSPDSGKFPTPEISSNPTP